MSQNVKLADGKLLQTCGKVCLRVAFGMFTCSCTFVVLEVNVPNILGMTLFSLV